MLKCPKFRQSFDLGLYFNRQQRNKTLCLHLMQNHEKQALQITFLTKLLVLGRYTLPMETLPWVLSKIMLFPSLQKVCACLGEEKEKDFICGDTFHLSLHIFSKFTS